MAALRGAVVGFLGLTLLEAAVSSEAAVNNTNTLVGLATKAIRRWMDPTLPLIPDLRGPGKTPSVLGSDDADSGG